MGSRLILAALVALSALYTATFVGIAFARLTYPYELDFMSGGSLDHVAHVLDGNKLYLPPTRDFVPYLYAPLHIYLSAGFAHFLGANFVPLRLVSLLATLGIFAVIAVLVRRRTGNLLAAVAAFGLFAACYGILDSLYSLARVDALLSFFLIATSATLWLGKATKSAIFAGVLLTAAYFSKQTALVLFPFLCLSVFVLDRRRAVTFGAAFALSWLAAVGISQWYYGDWFHYYTWTLARRHLWEWEGIERFLVDDLWRLYPALGVIGWLCVDAWRRGERKETAAHGIELVGFATACCLSRMHVGGAANVIMPFVVAVCVGVGLALGAAWRRRLPHILIPLLVVVQLAMLAYEPTRYIPTEADEAANDELVRVLRETEGDVFLPRHGYLATLAGKRRHAHETAVLDVVRGADDDIGQRLHNEFWGIGLAEGSELVVLDEPGYSRFLWMLVDEAFIAETYRPIAETRPIRNFTPDDVAKLRAQWAEELLLPLESQVMYPVASYPTRPIRLFRKVR